MLAFFSIAPAGRDADLSGIVAELLDLVDRSGLDYRFGPMGTTVEGDWDAVMALIGRCHKLVAASAARVSTVIKIDDPVGRQGLLDDKVASVEEKLGRKLRK